LKLQPLEFSHVGYDCGFIIEFGSSNVVKTAIY
jgi:hypothetical protein